MQVAASLKEHTGKHIEVMVYGDGAFKDPVGKIWELADPVVSPAYTPGLEGTPNELKLKYLADNDFAAPAAARRCKDAIQRQHRAQGRQTSMGHMVSQGTTPRRLTDLIGSLCRPDLRLGRQGHPHRFDSGLF